MKEGVFLHAPNLYLRFIDNKDQSPSCFGFVVPVKVSKTSVGRHLIKRKLSSVVEKALLDIKPGFWGIFFAKKDISSISYQEIEKEALELLVKAKMLNQ